MLNSSQIGFFDECKRRYNIKLWKTFTDCFNCLPIAAIIDEKIFCCHGGLSPDLQDMEQIRRIVRPTDVPDTGLLCDLLWSDPDKEVKVRGFNATKSISFYLKFLLKHWMTAINSLNDFDSYQWKQDWGENDRGVSFTFGADVVSRFLRMHDLELICRGHQVRPPIFHNIFIHEYFLIIKLKSKLKNILIQLILFVMQKTGCWGWIWIFRKTTVGYTIFSTELLWWIR